jgi:sirohydrochlorin cobaltochelatase
MSSDGTWIVLLAHGSRDPRWRQPFERLRQQVAAASPHEVALAYLQQGAPTLEQVLVSVRDAGAGEAVVIPVFLSGGGHLLRDVPDAVAAAAERAQIAVRCTGALGEEDDVIAAMARAVLRLTAER